MYLAGGERGLYISAFASFGLAERFRSVTLYRCMPERKTQLRCVLSTLRIGTTSVSPPIE